MSFSLSHGSKFDVGGVGFLAEQLPPLPEVGAGQLDLRAFFWGGNGGGGGTGGDEVRAEGGGRPLELEIGSGKGTFLVQEAERTPEVDYLGIEWARQFWAYAADRVRRHGLSNVKLLRADAAVFVRAYVPAAVFRQVHIYFPDPWPKKRHHKRRLIQAPFLRELHRVLQPQGQVRIATDHSEYFAWMNEHIALVGDLFAVLPFESPTSAGAGELVGTNFERKYRREGRPFHALRLRKS